MKWLIGITLLGFIVFFHELGHFLAAKIFGVKVEAFSIGFGPILLHRTVRGTDYRISLLPLGGYCSMRGEKDFTKALEEKADRIDAAPDSLYGIHPLQRAVIGFAGPFFNVVFTWIALSVIAMVGYRYYSYPAEIRLADEAQPAIHSAARDGGMLTGDVVTSINGKEVRDFSDIVQMVAPRPHETLAVSVLRDGIPLTFSVRADFEKSDGTGKIGVMISETAEPIVRETERYAFFPALLQGIKETANYAALTIKSMALLFRGAELKNTISGPARITDMLGSTVQTGFSAGVRNGIASMLEFMSLISISLFILNLLPVPILDGGLILFAWIQFFMRRQIHPKAQYYVQFIGIAFIGILFVIGLSSDIAYFKHVWQGGAQ